MWCSNCQHEVPAVVQTTRGPLICSQCERELAERTGAASSPADDGIALESYDDTPEQELASPVDLLEQRRSNQRLRQIGRQLHSTYRHDITFGNSPPLQYQAVQPPPLAADTELRGISKQNAQATAAEVQSTGSSWFASMLLTGGALGCCCGTGLLAWATTHQLPKMWQWGMLSTMASEGALMLGLVWIAMRLWRNSRKLNRQLSGVDQQLAEVHQLAGSLSGSRMSSSQHYYNHFSQVASPQMLAANLQGQVDQLASRIAVGR
jgi:hypothetical protein